MFNPVVQYTATAGAQSFTFPWYVYEPAALTVEKDTTILVYSYDYTIDNASIQNTNGGQIELTTPATGGETIKITIKTAIQEVVDYPYQGVIRSESLNLQHDYTIQVLKELAYQLYIGGGGSGGTIDINYIVRVRPDEPRTSPPYIPPLATRKGYLAGWNATTGEWEAVTGSNPNYSIRISASEPRTTPMFIPDPTNRRNKLFGWNSLGEPEAVDRINVNNITFTPDSDNRTSPLYLPELAVRKGKLARWDLVTGEWAVDNHAVVVPLSETRTAPMQLPSFTNRVNKWAGWDATGNFTYHDAPGVTPPAPVDLSALNWVDRDEQDIYLDPANPNIYVKANAAGIKVWLPVILPEDKQDGVQFRILNKATSIDTVRLVVAVDPSGDEKYIVLSENINASLTPDAYILDTHLDIPVGSHVIVFYDPTFDDPSGGLGAWLTMSAHLDYGTKDIRNTFFTMYKQLGNVWDKNSGTGVGDVVVVQSNGKIDPSIVPGGTTPTPDTSEFIEDIYSLSNFTMYGSSYLHVPSYIIKRTGGYYLYGPLDIAIGLYYSNQPIEIQRDTPTLQKWWSLKVWNGKFFAKNSETGAVQVWGLNAFYDNVTNYRTAYHKYIKFSEFGFRGDTNIPYPTTYWKEPVTPLVGSDIKTSATDPALNPVDIIEVFLPSFDTYYFYYAGIGGAQRNLYMTGYNKDNRLGLGSAADNFEYLAKVPIVSNVLFARLYTRDIVVYSNPTTNPSTITNNSTYCVTSDVSDNTKLYAWGNNASGQLGIGNTTAQAVPAEVTLPNNDQPTTQEELIQFVPCTRYATFSGCCTFVVNKDKSKVYVAGDVKAHLDGTAVSYTRHTTFVEVAGLPATGVVIKKIYVAGVYDRGSTSTSEGSNAPGVALFVILENGDIYRCGTSGRAMHGSINELFPLTKIDLKGQTAIDVASNGHATYIITEEGSIFCAGGRITSGIGSFKIRLGLKQNDFDNNTAPPAYNTEDEQSNITFTDNVTDPFDLIPTIVNPRPKQVKIINLNNRGMNSPYVFIVYTDGKFPLPAGPVDYTLSPSMMILYDNGRMAWMNRGVNFAYTQ